MATSTDGAASDAIAALLRETAWRVTIPGAEAAFLAGPDADTAILALHGWGASAESMRFLGGGLAASGFAVLMPTLPGHGTDPEDLARTGPSEWIAEARRALVALADVYERVYLLGVSMGGALALQIACLECDRVAGLVTLNAPVCLDRPAFAREVMDGAAADRLSTWEGPAFVGPAVPEITYPERSRKSGIDLLAMTALAREALPLVRAPVLVLQSVSDHVVPRRSAETILAEVSSTTKSIGWLHRSYHMAQLDLDRDDVVRRTAAFINGLAEEPRAGVRDPTR